VATAPCTSPFPTQSELCSPKTFHSSLSLQPCRSGFNRGVLVHFNSSYLFFFWSRSLPPPTSKSPGLTDSVYCPYPSFSCSWIFLCFVFPLPDSPLFLAPRFFSVHSCVSQLSSSRFPSFSCSRFSFIPSPSDFFFPVDHCAPMLWRFPPPFPLLLHISDNLMAHPSGMSPLAGTLPPLGAEEPICSECTGQLIRFVLTHLRCLRHHIVVPV